MQDSNSPNRRPGLIASILDASTRAVLLQGIEEGLILHKRINTIEDSELGYFAKNGASRLLFSCLCKKLLDIVNESSDSVAAETRNVSCSFYVEITGQHFVMHLHRYGGDTPKYVLEKRQLNSSSSSGNMFYIQMLYKTDEGKQLRHIEYIIQNDSGEILDREPIIGSWCSERKA